MRIGQTSLIHFTSQLVATVAGFVATVYLARVLGAETLGVYFLVVAVYTWLEMFGTMGFRQSVVKRISEGERQDQRFTAALSLQFLAILMLAAVVLLASQSINAYVGNEISGALLLLVLTGIIFNFITSVLQGQKLVHVVAILQPIERIARTILQLGAVVLIGLTLFGLIYGHIVALALTALVGLYFISSRPARPRRKDFKSLLSFAKYSWLGSLSTRAFNAIDTVVLGFFVGTTLIGVYEVAWNVASVLAIFGSSVSHAVFPEISDLSADDDIAQARSVLNDALAFTGLFTIPGLFGAVILGEYVLAVYGAEFRQGYFVLIILTVARLFAAYQWQLVNALNAFNRPDLAFKVNLVFIITNVTLNVILVWQYGWAGAAIATAFSAGIALMLGYAAIESVIGVQIPYGAIGRQVIAALVMGLVVSLATIPMSVSIPTAIVLIMFGSSVYFAILLCISTRFRTTIAENLPIPAF